MAAFPFGRGTKELKAPIGQRLAIVRRFRRSDHQRQSTRAHTGRQPVAQERTQFADVLRGPNLFIGGPEVGKLLVRLPQSRLVRLGRGLRRRQSFLRPLQCFGECRRLAPGDAKTDLIGVVGGDAHRAHGNQQFDQENKKSLALQGTPSALSAAHLDLFTDQLVEARVLKGGDGNHLDGGRIANPQQPRVNDAFSVPGQIDDLPHRGRFGLLIFLSRLDFAARHSLS